MLAWTRRAEFWLPVALVVVALGGAQTLRERAFVELSQRERTAYGARPVWQAHFDALSATCGVGLLTFELHRYTEVGRWTLTGLGLVGAILYLLATRQVLARLLPRQAVHWPGPALILSAFVVALILSIAAAATVERVVRSEVTGYQAAWNAVSAFASLGLFDRPADEGGLWVYAGISVCGALGWPLWLLFWWRALPLRILLVWVGGWVVWLGAAAMLVTVLELPREIGRGWAGAPVATEEIHFGNEFVRRFEQVALAGGAGIASEPVADRVVTEGTKAVLAFVVLVGGQGGAAGGGLRWPVVVGALAILLLVFGRGRFRHDLPEYRRAALAAVVLVGAVLAWTGLVAVGLLLIEGRTASGFHTPPTVADAWLESCAAVGGASLTSGLTAKLSDASLSSGFRREVDLYPYGMGWLMAAMLVGRLLPVLVIARLAALRFTEGRSAPRILV
ncbi:MAG: hypothetical protein IPM18_03380 [Phycisphaerales bacterium]|nr:hypothetical protein [Phycisphaerales bacterium]